MFVQVDLGTQPGTVTLEEPADCTRFHVAVRGDDLGQVDNALTGAGVGRIEGDHAFVTIEALQRLAEGRVPDSWDGDFAAMLDYARTKGWLDPSGTAIQAHLELDH